MNDIQNNIYNHLLTLFIEDGMSLGDKIPTEMSLAKEFSTSRMNAHYAIKELETKGYVSRNKKQGTVIRKLPEKNHVFRLQNASSNNIFILASPSRPSFNVHWDQQTISELETILTEEGYKIFFENMELDRKSFDAIMDKVVKKNCFSMILVLDFEESEFLKNNLDILSRYHGEVYFMNKGDFLPSELPYNELVVDNYDEGFIAAQYLIDKSYTDLLFLTIDMGDPEPYAWVQERTKGIENGIKYHKKKKDINFTLMYKTHKEDLLFIDAVEFLKASPNKIGIIAQNDLCASWFIDYAKTQGLFPQKDFGLISYDDYFPTRNYNLTTIAPPINKIAKTLAGMILEKSSFLDESSRISVRIRSHIIERDTC